MKKNFYKLTLSVLAVFGFLYSGAQTFEIRTVENDIGYLTVQMRETSGTGTPTTATNIVDITFVVRYPSGAVDMDLLCASNDYSIIDGLAGEQAFGGFDYHYWNGDISTPIHPPHDWTVNVWEDIAVFKATGDIGSGLFEIAQDDWDGRSLNWNQGGNDYAPTINGSLTYSYPTIVYDRVWVGGSFAGFESNWFWPTNWVTECGGAGSAPTAVNNVLIPDVSGASGYYPDVNMSGTMACKNLKIASGAQLTVPSTNGSLAIAENLFTDGSLIIVPNANVTISGDTYIGGSESIIVQASATGVGSFIDNGTITYGGSGSAKVQTYMSNSAGSGFFDLHLVGPTVNEENYTGGGTGAFLIDFILGGVETHAYNYQDGWHNIYNPAFEVRTGAGIAISTTDNLNHTLEMTGSLITGNVSSPNLAFTSGGNNYELISNPYPSSIDFDALASVNSGVVDNHYWIWNPAGNNYVERAGNAGIGSQYIQVGQGFFVETNSPGTFSFTNLERTHSTSAFREQLSNILTITAEGGMIGYRDDAIVRFNEEATSGYDKDLEAEFWESQNSDATSLRSIAEGNLELAINVLPLESLNSGEMLSVPLIFTCGYNTEYSFTFSDIESFDFGTEIWLEDKLIGGDWVSINNQPEYIFTGSPNDAIDRFVLHFFGPTGTEEIAKPTVDVYSSGQYAYVRNNTEDAIREIRIYSLSGALMNHIKTPDQKFIKLWVADEMAYYVITVITDQQVYTKKLFISK